MEKDNDDEHSSGKDVEKSLIWGTLSAFAWRN